MAILKISAKELLQFLTNLPNAVKRDDRIRLELKHCI
jgi:hypothetical protein